MRLLLLVLLALMVSPTAQALEGGSTSSSPEWQGVKPKGAPSEAARAKELADRQAAIAADIARLNKRLKTTPDAGKMGELRNKLQVAAVVQNGCLKGTEIGIRYWILHKGGWTKADGQIKPGQKLQLDLAHWDQVIAKDGKLSQHMIFNDTGQGLQTPVYWVTGGAVAPGEVLR